MNLTETDVEVDVRQSMRILPSFLQWFLTWFTGKPLIGQKPLINRSSYSHILTAYACLFTGFAISAVGILYFSWLTIPLLLVGWLLTVSGARKIATTINHYCVHGDLLPLKWKDYHAFVSEINSIVIFIQPFAEYKDEHLAHHKVKKVATIYDPDMVFMWQLGFRPGMAKKDLWSNFYRKLVSPWFHYTFLRSRIVSNLSKGPMLRKIAVVLYGLSLLACAIFLSWPVVIFGWIFPLTILYHMSALGQFCSEHRWLKMTDENGTVDNLSQSERVVRSRVLTDWTIHGGSRTQN